MFKKEVIEMIDEIAEIMKRLEEHEKRIVQLESLVHTKPEAIKKKISIKEFILSKTPINDVQKTLAIGYYLEKHEGLSSFNKKDLESGFGNAKERSPENINDKVNQNIKKGFMMEAKGGKDNFTAWALTNSGEKYVENGFKAEK
jgi:hypothetical protein